MEPTNLSGAIVFWVYIIAALWLISIALNTIYRLPGPTPNHARFSLRSREGAFALLALHSFGTLSYNMLNVLIHSYRRWALQHEIPLPSSLIGTKGLLGPSSIPLELWDWSLNSSQFQDFGQAITQDPVRYFWSGAGLWSTFFVIWFVATKGRTARVPNLWAFIGLAEILPVSFTQNLFYLALLRSPQSALQSTEGVSSIAYAVSGALYSICLYYAPNAGDNLIIVILFARILLLAPVLLPLQPKPISLTTSMNISIGIWVLVFALNFQTFRVPLYSVTLEQGWLSIFAGINSHPAVSALGHDFLLSAISWMRWRTVSRTLSNPQKAVEQANTVDKRQVKTK